MVLEPPRRRLWLRELDEPECPAGWVTGPPDFVGVGAQRCGTTWWFRGAIRPHPQFKRPFKPLKELHFFDRYWMEEPPRDFAARYARLFPRPPGAISGEWTPRYMCDPWAVRMLAEAAPQARILIMLRDPIERFRSGLEHEVGAVEREAAAPRISVVGDAIYRGLYAAQVERVLRTFGRDRVLVLQYERCLTDPLGEMRRMHRFLGVEPLGRIPEKLQRPRPAAEQRLGLPEPLRADLAAAYREDVRRLVELWPDLDLGLWPSFRDLA